jgi:hypothetical protein
MLQNEIATARQVWKNAQAELVAASAAIVDCASEEAIENFTNAAYFEAEAKRFYDALLLEAAAATTELRSAG